MNLALARSLSVIFHPLLLPTYLFYLVLYWLPESAITFPATERWLILTGIWLVTFVIPALGTYMLFRGGVVNSMQLQDRNQRRIPFLFTAICYAGATYFIQEHPVFGELLHFIMLLVTLSVLVTYVVSLFWKISAHSIGMGGFLGILILLNSLMPDGSLLNLIIGFIVLCGTVMSARLALNEHTPAQVYAGFFAGLALNAAFFLFL